MKSRVLVLLSVACLAAHSIDALAAELRVTRTAAGVPTVVFNDDFETDTVGTDPAIGAGDIGGSWMTNDSTEVVVSDGPSEPIAAFDQFLKVQNSVGAVVGIAQGRFGSTVSSGSLSAEFSAQLPASGTNHALNMSYENSGGTSESWTIIGTLPWLTGEAGLADPGDIGPGEGALAFFNGSWNYATSGGSTLVFPLGTWVDVAMDYDLDSGSLSFTINGNTSDNVVPYDLLGDGTPDGDAVGIYFRQGAGANGTQPNLSYVGGVIPEPATATLFALGLLSVATRRRRSE